MREHLLASSFRLGVPGGNVAAALVLVALLVVVVAGWREHQQIDALPRRLLLNLLRMLSAGCAALLIVQPQWLGQNVEQVQGRVALLLDASRSMTVHLGDSTRLATGVGLMQRAFDGAAQKPLVYSFGDEITQVTRAALSDNKLALSDETRIEHALRALVAAQGEDLGAIVLVSDGADRSPSFAAPALKSLGVRVHSVAIGDEAELSDVSIKNVSADQVAFLRQPAQVQVTVRAPASHAAPIRVTLRKGTDVLGEVAAELGPDGTATATLPFTPTQLGRAVYSVSVPTDPDDAVPANNERSFLLRVTRERLRVLLVCGQPSWDARFLRAFLKGNPAIDLITFFILRTQSDNSMAPPEELSLIPFPTQELFEQHLQSFDLVIFQDFEFGPYQMAVYLPRIHDYVVSGGSFAMLGGEHSFGAGGYVGTPIAEILPVRLAGGGRNLDEGEFVPRVVDQATHHPVIELVPRPEDNRAAWQSVAPLLGTNLVLGLQQDAQALLVHPTLNSDSGEPMPVLAVGSAGRGRTLAFTSDASYRFSITTAGRLGDASVYERFWDRALRWLVRDPLLDPAQLTSDRERYGPGAKLRASLWLRDPHYRPLGPGLFRVALLDDHGKALQEVPVEIDAEGRGEVSLTVPSAAAAYKLVVHPEAGGAELAQEVFVVESGGDELADPRARPALLREIAEATGGSFYASPAEMPSLDRLECARTRVLSVAVHAPFGTGWFFALFVAVFGAEWWMRRRFGLR